MALWSGAQPHSFWIPLFSSGQFLFHRWVPHKCNSVHPKALVLVLFSVFTLSFVLLVLIFCCGCNRWLWTSWLKTKQIYHLTVWEVRSVTWVLPDENQGAGSAPWIHFWRMRGRVLFSCLLAFPEAVRLPQLMPAFLHLQSQQRVDPFNSTLHWLPFLLLFSTFQDSCDYIGSP